MSPLTLVLTILQLFTDLFLIAVVMLQSGKSAGITGVISGGADTFLSKGKAKTMDAKLARMTAWVAFAFVILTFVLNLV